MVLRVLAQISSFDVTTGKKKAAKYYRDNHEMSMFRVRMLKYMGEAFQCYVESGTERARQEPMNNFGTALTNQQNIVAYNIKVPQVHHSPECSDVAKMQWTPITAKWPWPRTRLLKRCNSAK